MHSDIGLLRGCEVAVAGGLPETCLLTGKANPRPGRHLAGGGRVDRQLSSTAMEVRVYDPTTSDAPIPSQGHVRERDQGTGDAACDVVATDRSSVAVSLSRSRASTTLPHSLGLLPNKTAASCSSGVAVAVVRPAEEEDPRGPGQPPSAADTAGLTDSDSHLEAVHRPSLSPRREPRRVSVGELRSSGSGSGSIAHGSASALHSDDHPSSGSLAGGPPHSAVAEEASASGRPPEADREVPFPAASCSSPPSSSWAALRFHSYPAAASPSPGRTRQLAAADDSLVEVMEQHQQHLERWQSMGQRRRTADQCSQHNQAFDDEPSISPEEESHEAPEMMMQQLLWVMEMLQDQLAEEEGARQIATDLAVEFRQTVVQFQTRLNKCLHETSECDDYIVELSTDLEDVLSRRTEQDEVIASTDQALMSVLEQVDVLEARIRARHADHSLGSDSLEAEIDDLWVEMERLADARSLNSQGLLLQAASASPAKASREGGSAPGQGQRPVVGGHEAVGWGSAGRQSAQGSSSDSQQQQQPPQGDGPLWYQKLGNLASRMWSR